LKNYQFFPTLLQAVILLIVTVIQSLIGLITMLYQNFQMIMNRQIKHSWHQFIQH